jgi:AcrR family transcriptional regulator
MHNAMDKKIQTSKRSYRSDLRAQQADSTRKAVIAAAGRVCRAGGWPNATIAAIAKEAGVSKETIYGVFGSKVALIGEMVKANVAEHVPGQHFLEQKRPRAISAESDPIRQIELWADYLTDILKRVAPLMYVVRTGSQAEPEMSELYRALHQGRRANLAILAQSIFSRGPLRNGLSVERVTNILWQSASPEMFSLLTEVDGYSNEEYARWLAETLKALLLR